MTAATRTITFKLNGAPVTADVKPHHNLVELLQAQFGLTGARESCGQGLCGCCTVLVNGRAVSGCLYLALFIDARRSGRRLARRRRIRCGGPHQTLMLPASPSHRTFTNRCSRSRMSIKILATAPIRDVRCRRSHDGNPNWWQRSFDSEYLRPIAHDDRELHRYMRRLDWN